MVVGVFALAMTVVPALADGSDLVVNSGETMSGTMVNSNSNSGGNLSDGSYGGDGGNGGDIRNRGDVNKSMTGRGGNGGDSGVGGTVITGTALAVTDATNEIGNSRTTIDRCACEGAGDDGHSMTLNRTRTMQMSYTGADANTGNNEALGSVAGSGGDGGTIGDERYGHPMPMLMESKGGNHHDGDKNKGDSDVDKSSTGIGGNGGSSSDGGFVQSGNSTSRTTFVNVVGRNITRISR